MTSQVLHAATWAVRLGPAAGGKANYFNSYRPNPIGAWFGSVLEHEAIKSGWASLVIDPPTVWRIVR